MTFSLPRKIFIPLNDVPWFVSTIQNGACNLPESYSNSSNSTLYEFSWYVKNLPSWLLEICANGFWTGSLHQGLKIYIQ